MNNNKYQKYNKIIGGASSQPDIELIKKLKEKNKVLEDELHEARERLLDLECPAGLFVPTPAEAQAARLEEEREENKYLKQKLEKKILQNKQLIQLDTINASNYNKLKEHFLNLQESYSELESEYKILIRIYNYEIKNRNN